MSNYIIKIGVDIQTGQPLLVDLYSTGHFCITGSTNSGKSLATLYFLYGILSLQSNVELSVADFKRSNDYNGISPNFAEFDAVTELIENFYTAFENTRENYQGIKILVLDEYCGYVVWLSQSDKKKCEEIKSKISNILMMGRSRHCFVWCIQQRMTAQLFPSGIGAIDNFQVLIGLSRLTVDSRRSLFANEHLVDSEFEKNFAPHQGQGLALIDGEPLHAIQIPYISDKDALKKLLCMKAQSKI